MSRAIVFVLLAGCADVLGIVDVPTPSDAGVDAPFDSLVVPDGPFEGCNGGAEDCSNGVDDNCNGLVDCEDPVCQGASYQCVDRAPAGWTLVGFAAATGANVPGACSGAYGQTTAQGHAGLSAQAATCGCSCPSSQATNTSCPPVAVNGYSGNSCNNLVQSFNVNAQACGDFNSAEGSIMVTEGAPTSQGSCGTPTWTRNKPPLDWANSYAVCGYTAPDDGGGGCSAGSQCVKLPSSAFDAKPCVAQSGDVACPGAPYTKKTTVLTGVSDDRDCSACTCSASGGACNATTTAYLGSGCSGTSTSAQVNVACTDQAANVLSIYVNSIVTTSATCSPSTSSPIGSASGNLPVTVCCP